MEHCRGVSGHGRGWWGKFHPRVSKMSTSHTWSKYWNQLWSLPRFSGIFIFIFYTATFCNFVLPSIKCILAEMTDFRDDSISRTFHGELVSHMKAMIKDSWVKAFQPGSMWSCSWYVNYDLSYINHIVFVDIWLCPYRYCEAYIL